MLRKRMIEALMIDSLVDALDRHPAGRCQDLPGSSHHDFEHLSDDELQEEFARRGLSLDEGQLPAERGDCSDDDVDALALCGLQRGCHHAPGDRDD